MAIYYNGLIAIIILSNNPSLSENWNESRAVTALNVTIRVLFFRQRSLILFIKVITVIMADNNYLCHSHRTWPSYINITAYFNSLYCLIHTISITT